MSQSNIAVVGLGLMGWGIARNLLESGYKLVGYDLSRERMQELVALGGEASKSPAHAADNADIVITVLPEPRDVEEAAIGQDGVHETFNEGGLLIDFSTIDPVTTRRVGEKLASKNIRMLECKMGGDSSSSNSATLALMVGGSEEDMLDVEPVLERISTSRTYCGKLGAASAMKLVNNMLAASIMMLNGEALVLGKKAGLDLDAMVDVFQQTFAANSALKSVFQDRVFKGDFEPGFFTRLALKDLRLAVQMGAELGSVTHYGAVTQQLLNAASNRGYATDHITATVKLYEEIAGVELRKD